MHLLLLLLLKEKLLLLPLLLMQHLLLLLHLLVLHGLTLLLLSVQIVPRHVNLVGIFSLLRRGHSIKVLSPERRTRRHWRR